MAQAMSDHARAKAHGRGHQSQWQPPPRAWHQIWVAGTADLLPYGLLSPASDYIWREMWLQPTYLTSRDIQAMTGCPYEQVKHILRAAKSKECVIPLKMGGAALQHRKETRHRMERTTDYKGGDHCRIEYRPVRPETTIAMHLRWLHHQPTPDCPPGLPIRQKSLWMLMAGVAVGRAAVLNIAAAAERLGMANNTLRDVAARLRNKGLITRLYGCQMSVWRLTGDSKLNKKGQGNQYG